MSPMHRRKRRRRPSYLVGVTALVAAAAISLSACSDESPSQPDPDPDPVADPVVPAPGNIEHYAGTGQPGFDGDGHPLLTSRFYWPVDMLITPEEERFVLDWNNHKVRQLQTDGTLRTVLGTDFIGDGPSDLSDLSAPGAPGTSINLNHPTDLLKLPDGRFLLTAWHNHKLRVWDPATGLAYVMCGGGAGFAGDGGELSTALFNQPQSTVLAPDGSLYVLDQRNQRIRKIDSSDMVTTVVGSGTAGFSGDGGDPVNAEVAFPAGSNPPPAGGLALDAGGRIYFADILNNRVRMADPVAHTIETVVGDGMPGYGGDGGPGTAASLNNPRDIEVGPDGRVYIADELNNRVRAYDPATGIVTTVAGVGTAGRSGDGGPATAAELNRPAGLEFDNDGLLYIADTYNHVIRRVNLEEN